MANEEKGKIKVLHVGLNVVPDVGGIETYSLKISTYIDKSRFQFDFLSYKGEEPCFRSELEALGCCFRYVTRRSKDPISHRRDLNRILESEKYDVIHCHLNSLSYLDPCLAGLRHGAKVIVHSRNAGCTDGFRTRIIHKINSYRIPKDSITMLAVSDKAGKWMFGEESSFTVINNGLDCSIYRYSEASRVKIREKYGFGDEEVIVHTGAFRKQKNHHFLIDVFREYLEYNPEAKLLLVGDGDLMPEIKAKVSFLGLDSSVIFAGRCSNIPELLCAADKFLFPSLYEGFPNSLIEAEASGLFCLSSDTITNQVMLDGLCRVKSLEEGPKAWARALFEGKPLNRDSGADAVEAAGLGIEKEIRTLSGIYEMLARGEDE